MPGGSMVDEGLTLNLTAVWVGEGAEDSTVGVAQVTVAGMGVWLAASEQEASRSTTAMEKTTREEAEAEIIGSDAG